MSTNQDQKIFTRNEIVTQLEAACHEEKVSDFISCDRLQKVLEYSHLDGLVDAGMIDVADLETRAANTFARPVSEIQWGFTRILASTSLGVRRADVERLTGSRLEDVYDIALMERGGHDWIELSGTESYLYDCFREPTPWEIPCEEGETVALSAWISPFAEDDELRLARHERHTARFDELAEASADLDPRERAQAFLLLAEELRLADATEDLAHLPVIALSLGASAELDDLLAKAVVLKVEQRVAALIEAPLTTEVDEEEGTFLGDVLALERPDITRARAAYAAAVESAAATRRTHAALRRCEAQRILTGLGLGRINHVEASRLAALTDREIVECAQVVVRAYPNASLAGGFFYLLGKPEGFNEFWESFRAYHDLLVPRLEHWASEHHGLDSDDWSVDAPTIERASIDDLTAILTEGIVAVVEMSLRPETSSQDLSRSLSLSTGGTGFVEEISSFTSHDVEADQAIAWNPERTPRERAEATLRLAGFLANDVHAGPTGEDSPFLTSRTHLMILRHLPPMLRIALIRPGTEHQVTWRKMLSAAVNGPIPE